MPPGCESSQHQSFSARRLVRRTHYGLLAASFVLGVFSSRPIDCMTGLAAAKDMLAGAPSISSKSVGTHRACCNDPKSSCGRRRKMETLGPVTGGLAHTSTTCRRRHRNLDLLNSFLERRAARAGNGPRRRSMPRSSGRELTRDCLPSSRRQPLLPEKIDANELIGGSASCSRARSASGSGFGSSSIRRHSADRCDGFQLETAMANLANKARDAMPNGGRAGHRLAQRES